MFWISFHDVKRNVDSVSLLLVPNEYFLVTRLLLKKGKLVLALLYWYQRKITLIFLLLLQLSLFSIYQRNVVLVALLLVPKKRLYLSPFYLYQRKVVLVYFLGTKGQLLLAFFSLYQRNIVSRSLLLES